MNRDSRPEDHRPHARCPGAADAVLLVLVLVLLPAVGCTMPAARTPAVESACAFPATEPGERIVQWTLGCSRSRQSKAEPTGTSIVWHSAPTHHGATIVLSEPVARQCVKASSVLPRPNSSEVFIVSGGLLFTVNRKGARKSVRLDRGSDSDWRMSRLLALRRTSGPLQILAEMVRTPGVSPGQPAGQPAGKSLWLLTVHGDKAAGGPFTKRYGTADEFAKDFVVPRCADPKLGECLVVRESAGASPSTGSGERADRLVSQHRRGAAGTDVPGTQDVVDAVWDGEGQMVLITEGDCSP